MTNLVIVESPAKCSKIQGFLGQGWKVIASLGHIRHLKQELDAVGIQKDFESSWEFMKDKAKATTAIKDAAKQATKIYLAADDDREGELIAYSVCLLLKLDPATTARSVFHEITEKAVKDAIENPRTLDMNKVKAAEARAMLDMMVGFTMSPLLWKHVGPALSAGRCQTPALRLVKDRETVIETFQTSHSWKIHGKWSVKGQQNSTPWPAHLTDELEDEESARTYLENHSSEPYGKVFEAKTTTWQEAPPLPLITSSLQQQASTLFRSTPKITMATAQRLYESGYITYMRTDRAVLSEEAIQEAHKQVTSLYGPTYVGSATQQLKQKAKAKKTKDTSKPAPQEAHEAIRPTDFSLLDLPIAEDWSVKDRNIYKLIWLRAIQSTMAPTNGEQRKINFVADGDEPEDFQWTSVWRKTLFNGWRQAATKETTDKDDAEANQKEAEEAEWQLAISIQPDTLVQWNKLQAEPHQTKAPQRYNEANLIQALEKEGIGRPSTFANLITTIQDKAYVETKSFESKETHVLHLELNEPNKWPPNEIQKTQKYGAEKDRLCLTPVGQQVLQFLTTHFDDLFQYSFTAQMEARLDAISEGKEVWKSVLQDTWTSYKDRYEVQSKAKGSIEVSSRSIRKEFGNGLVAVITKKGPLLLQESPDGDKDKTVFYGWPSPTTELQTLTLEEAIVFIEQASKERQGTTLGMHEGLPVVKKQGKFGLYAVWNGKTAACQEEDSLEQVLEKLTAKASKALRVVGQFEIRDGQYGPYMFKHQITGASRKFVSIPKGINIQDVTEAQLISIFQHELQQKARSGAYGAKTNTWKKK
jgi:DNA topoisomerase-1